MNQAVVEELEKQELIGDLEFLRKLTVMKVLIVDDKRNMVKTIENMLNFICSFKRKSESVFRANDGKEALNILMGQPPKQKSHIDMVLLDWNMPKLPGIEVIRTIRTSELSFVKDIPVIMITGESRMNDVNDAMFAGVDNYLLKPFVLEDLRRRMNPILRQYWSGFKMRRAADRRSETRYPAEVLRMKVEVAILNGSVRIADVINISEHGVRLEMDTPERFEIKSVAFQIYDKSGGFENRNNCVSLMPDIKGTPKRIQISVWFKFGFEDVGIHENWLKWLNAVKGKYIDFRSQQV